MDSLPPDHGDAATEARACRDSAALFDFSFVAGVRLRGRSALTLLERFTSRRLADLAPGRIRLALRLDGDDAVVSDLTVWRHDTDDFEVMSGRREDVSDLRALAGSGMSVPQAGGRGFVYAMQGPRSLQALARFAERDALAALPWFGFTRMAIAGTECLVGRLGYSGERGFEVLGDAGETGRLWRTLAKAARPAGSVAMNLLRIEAGLALFTRECCLGATADELGLSRLVSRPLPAPKMRLVSFLAPPQALAHAATLPQRRPATGEIAVTSWAHSTNGSVLGLGFVPLAEARAGARPSDLHERITGVELLSGPALADARQRPRGPWCDTA